MREILAALRHRPLVLTGASLALLWAVYVGATLRASSALLPLDTSRCVMGSLLNQACMVQTTSTGKAQVVWKEIGPVTTWKNGLVYWDDRKHSLFCALPGKKPQAIHPKPELPLDGELFLMPAPDAVYVKQANTIYRVQLSGGATQVVSNAQVVHSSDRSAVFAVLTSKNTIVVHYPGGKTQTVATPNRIDPWSWDYDPVQDAVVWLQPGAVCYRSPTRTWSRTRSPFTTYSKIGFGGANGDIWMQMSGDFGTPGIRVLSAAGADKGWRWRWGPDDNKDLADHFMELSPEQEKLARALPDYQ